MTWRGTSPAEWARKVERRMDVAVRKITEGVFAGVIEISPVDKGRFKANWQPAIGSAPSGIIEATDPSGAMVMAKVSGVVAGVKAGDVIYMVNNLPYARRLEDGYSKQAPAGMVALTVQRFQPIAAEAIRQASRVG